MGLNIHLNVNNHKQVYTDAYSIFDFQHSLSREFCNFMSRRDVLIEKEPELDQIGRLFKIDIEPLYQMNNHSNDEYLVSAKDYLSDDEWQSLKLRMEKADAELEGNLETVLNLINELVDKLTKVQNLHLLLTDNNFDTLNNPYYFSDFDLNKGEGYIRNNFGQDLRNFKRFLEYAKGKGTTTVWFEYG